MSATFHRRRRPALARQRPHRDPVPAEVALARLRPERRRYPDLLGVRSPVAGGLRQAVDGLRDLRRADEDPLDGAEVGEGCRRRPAACRPGWRRSSGRRPRTTSAPSGAASTTPLVMSSRAVAPLSWIAPMASAKQEEHGRPWRAAPAARRSATGPARWPRTTGRSPRRPAGRPGRAEARPGPAAPSGSIETAPCRPALSAGGRVTSAIAIVPDLSPG